MAKAAWFPDPMARNELRFFDGSEWTDHVSNGGIQGVDALAPENGSLDSIQSGIAENAPSRDDRGWTVTASHGQAPSGTYNFRTSFAPSKGNSKATGLSTRSKLIALSVVVVSALIVIAITMSSTKGSASAQQTGSEPCWVGRWKVVSETLTLSLADQAPLTVTGGSGLIVTLADPGDVSDSGAPTRTLTGNSPVGRVTLEYSGFAQGTEIVSGNKSGTMTITTTGGNMTESVSIGGTTQQQPELIGIPHAQQFTCNKTTLSLSASQVVSSSESSTGNQILLRQTG